MSLVPSQTSFNLLLVIVFVRIIFTHVDVLGSSVHVDEPDAGDLDLVGQELRLGPLVHHRMTRPKGLRGMLCLLRVLDELELSR